ncbi:MAG: lysozyme [Mycobacteriales bacterium]|jgi:peptidoglycan hydrolase-like protein with peptidoglycan-binding domain
MKVRVTRRSAAAFLTAAAALGSLAVMPAAQAKTPAPAARAAGATAAQPGVAPHIAGVCGSHWGNTFPPTTVRQGSVDTTDPSAVKLAQCYLNLSILSSNLDVDGRFGSLTDAMVRKFQRSNCANVPPVDGIVGPNTWAALRFWANSPNFACN